MTNILVIIDPKKSSTFEGAYARITRINGIFPQLLFKSLN